MRPINSHRRTQTSGILKPIRRDLLKNSLKGASTRPLWDRNQNRPEP